jgi:DNA-binding CsgD family transcriptional regulator
MKAIQFSVGADIMTKNEQIMELLSAEFSFAQISKKLNLSVRDVRQRFEAMCRIMGRQAV